MYGGATAPDHVISDYFKIYYHMTKLQTSLESTYLSRALFRQAENSLVIPW